MYVDVDTDVIIVEIVLVTAGGVDTVILTAVVVRVAYSVVDEVKVDTDVTTDVAVLAGCVDIVVTVLAGCVDITVASTVVEAV